MPKQKQCINTLLSKLGGVDKKICNLSERLEMIKKIVTQHCQKAPEEEHEEECPDIKESERAVVEAIEKIFVEDLLTREPEGEA